MAISGRPPVQVAERWPDLARVSVRHRADFSYVDGAPARLDSDLTAFASSRQPARVRRARPDAVLEA
jgi:hypothetical protein